VRIIPNGILESPLPPAKRQDHRPVQPPVALRKGFQHVLRAVHDLDLGWRVEVIGDGPFRGELEQIAAGSRTPVNFHGWLDQRDPVLPNCMPEDRSSWFRRNRKNFPSVLLEAMRAGMAVIASAPALPGGRRQRGDGLWRPAMWTGFESGSSN